MSTRNEHVRRSTWGSTSRFKEATSMKKPAVQSKVTNQHESKSHPGKIEAIIVKIRIKGDLFTED